MVAQRCAKLLETIIDWAGPVPTEPAEQVTAYSLGWGAAEPQGQLMEKTQPALAGDSQY